MLLNLHVQSDLYIVTQSVPPKSVTIWRCDCKKVFYNALYTVTIILKIIYSDYIEFITIQILAVSLYTTQN